VGGHVYVQVGTWEGFCTVSVMNVASMKRANDRPMNGMLGGGLKRGSDTK